MKQENSLPEDSMGAQPPTPGGLICTEVVTSAAGTFGGPQAPPVFPCYNKALALQVPHWDARQCWNHILSKLRRKQQGIHICMWPGWHKPAGTNYILYKWHLLSQGEVWVRLLKIQLNSAWKEGGTWSSFCFHSLRYHCDVSSEEIPLWHPVLAVSFAPGIRIHMLQFPGCCANSRLTSLVSQQHGSWFTASRRLSSIRRATQLRKYSVDLSYQPHLLSPLLLLCYASLQREEGKDFMSCSKTWDKGDHSEESGQKAARKVSAVGCVEAVIRIQSCVQKEKSVWDEDTHSAILFIAKVLSLNL